MMSNHIFQIIEQLVKKGIEHELITLQDEVYVRNQILGLLQVEGFLSPKLETTIQDIPDLLEALVDYAVQEKIIEDVLDDKEILTANIMNCFLAKPADVNREFYEQFVVSPEAATDYFYKLSKNSNYIQTKRIAKNIQYKTESPYGKLDITINLSKPEKDPEQIKRERAMKQQISYPQCLLCRENEGYVGRTGYPARSNHRIIEVPLEGETWFLQYSPYVYYNEHSILLSGEHRPMEITSSTFERLTAFVEKFPHYFMGSNADLPIVGGSILSHDHYQGGRYTFAMTKAADAFSFPLVKYPNVIASVVEWPMSVIRIRSENKKEVVEAAAYLLEQWQNYSDPTIEIVAFTGDTPHNTITPIARMRDHAFELDLVLRNNRTTEQYPFGIFHPHEDVHHIKKENIGLIEVMGLAVLPPRLKDELNAIEAHLLDQQTPVADYHQAWVKQIKQQNDSINTSNVKGILHQALGDKFTRVLEDAGVFKSSEDGKQAFKRFIETVNHKQ
ncbi:UDP-glucose--hexose-1-phosphate uridylyltransferase [Paraliobacillus sp. JSM ZJ581]|uniref:UDP-glucose--hexose-1-phosphate uridylyltransferase n=1 Tax=Paraliobacillus sp. JSM ZJ581 TaxID=3342118 RepID=UPI0035A9889A